MSNISVRIPWHDSKWNGCYCRNPFCNTYCKTLPNIAMAKKDSEQEHATQDWLKMSMKDWPACGKENGGIMNPIGYTRTFRHVYKGKGGRHDVLLDTDVDCPPYSAFGVPYWYLMLSNQDQISEEHPEFAEVEKAPFPSDWLYGAPRQKDVLNWFRSNLQPDQSLCVFYCKNGTPIDDEGQRLIVGLGDITNIYPLREYDTSTDYTYPLWEIMFQHSIRPELGKSRGFLLPYQEYLDLPEETILKVTGKNRNQVLDEIKISLDKFGDNKTIRNELSYGCELISNVNMLAILEVARKSIEKIKSHRLVGSDADWDLQLRWIDESIAKVKDKISPFPGFANVLKSIGVNYSNLMERDFREAGCGPKDNPWDYYEKLMAGEIGFPEQPYNKELPTNRDIWKAFPDDYKETLKTLSRVEIPTYLAKEFMKDNDLRTRFMVNPYILSEWSLKNYDYEINTQTIDTGFIVDPDIQGENIPAPNVRIDSLLDERRLRSMVMERLFGILDEGDTLCSVSEMQTYLEGEFDKKSLVVPPNLVLHHRTFFSREISYLPDEKPSAVQLKEYFGIEKWLTKQFSNRAAQDVKKPITEDWDSLVKSNAKYNSANAKSVQAATEQARALEVLSKKKLSVLTGGAGTGKTTVVEYLLKNPHIQKEGVLLLAPTGKARVRLGEKSQGFKALTIAQFLLYQDRFDGEKMMAFDNEDAPRYEGERNLIIDECSMITERDMYILLKAIELSKINRIILIGDPYQLPPIGGGRPFADLYAFLKDNEDENLKSALVELKTVVRNIQSKEDIKKSGIRDEESETLNLAAWFGGRGLSTTDKEIWEKIERGELNDNPKSDLQLLYWNDGDDLYDCLHRGLQTIMKCQEDMCAYWIKRMLGMDNISKTMHHPSDIERFQILTPVLNPVWGSHQINDYIQSLVIDPGAEYIQFSVQKLHQGDKVMLLENRKTMSYPDKKKVQLSNGQMGFVNEIQRDDSGNEAHVTFAGQPNKSFHYWGMKGDEKETKLELAYAITIHKSQGSDFDGVLIVLPKSGKILSRELIYTALTRFKKKVVLLIEDNINWLHNLSKPQYSALAKRNTNMFSRMSVREQPLSVPYASGLIHASKADMKGNVVYVRSKSEIIIANELISAGIRFEYEKLKTDPDSGQKCLPDFTIITDDDDIVWEHLGMLGIEEYRKSWERKKKLYEEMGYIEGQNLFTTQDRLDGSFHSEDVIEVINKIKSKLD